MSSRIRPLLLGGVVLAALGVAGCTAGSDDSAPTVSVTPSAPSGEQTTPPPAPLEPDADDPAQVALTRFDPDGDAAANASITGPAVVSPGQILRIDAWCTGGDISYEVMTSAVDQERRAIASGSFACDDTLQMQDHQQVDAEGPVQVLVTTGGTSAGWVQARVQ
ncbi:hypothetical protein [Microbacterium sp. CIAB417]|uniref:hypothetical protein n=1 Tax=Microbacterium sp. CIAB417 TaxID=2860287 RepID=UPI001FABD8FF|nr:hypothetical protein [Microbacterium sp. CIAB417]